MAKVDPQVVAHQEWIGFLQPVGLVVSPHALVRAGAILDRRDAEGQRFLRACTEEREFSPKEGPVAWLPDLQTFAKSVLNWSFSPKGYAGTDENPVPPELEIVLPEYEETLRPDFAIRELEPEDAASPWQLLVRALEPDTDFDRIARGNGQLEASAHGRMERLLRRTGVPAGLLFNGRTLRLLSAPRGESSGWLDFQVTDMVQTAGRPISTALRLLLSEQRLLSLPRHQRLAALLEDSRKFQNEVSERLAEQVLHALYEFLRGFQSAHDASRGELLREPLNEHPDEVYRALLTVILRLVFLLYTEERDMLPEEETFLRHYSLGGLYERLREDAALFPDTMDQRYGAWAQLLVLFRLVHDGADSGAMHLPQRHGVLFDPDRFKFLEGRPSVGARQSHERIEPPLVPDGTIYRALDKLLILEGERISYRALDVEQIGSVYETMMGFRLETASGSSVAIKATKKHGAPTTIDLEALLQEPASKRRKWVQDRTDRKLTDRVLRDVKTATNLEDLHAALDRVLDKDATPDFVPKGAIVLQPSEERRRSGSHYTPRELTEPIVRTTLEPILKRLRGEEDRPPEPEEILDLKVCDPAMGSGAFLVEACRQLGDALIESWHFHDQVPEIPPDEDEVVFARRLIAQRCLYGVDKNPVAVDLSKMSLWLVTLAKEHPLTFMDHALRHGDSLVGLSRRQIEALHWDDSKPPILRGMGVLETLDKVAVLRRRIREADESMADWELRDLWDQTQFELRKVRLFADLVVAAFFEGEKPKVREARRVEYSNAVVSGEADRYRDQLKEWRYGQRPLVPFHWEIEFPEVFERQNSGFDSFVGNPPFMGGTMISTRLGAGYRDWLYQSAPGARGRCDLVAYFFRRGFDLVRNLGTLGLIGCNTVAQGDTRNGGLGWICENGGEIFQAMRRLKWPGSAAVIVSVVHIIKGRFHGQRQLDHRDVATITAFLFYRGESRDPVRLRANKGKCFTGVKIYGQGFLFDDRDTKRVATSLDEMREILQRDPRNQERISPYIGGEEVNNSPTLKHHRYVIDFDELELADARKWPDLLAIVEKKVRTERQKKSREVAEWPWWRFWRSRRELYNAISGLERVLAVNCGATPHFGIAFQPANRVFAHSLAVLAAPTYSAFCTLQARPHETWARFFGSSMKDDLRYTPSDCFETFPFPENWVNHSTLEAAGKAYYEFRAALMVRHNEGLTKTYNRFHDPEERNPDILKLRELHTDMDRAVLDAYGWTNTPTDCEFLLDYEIDEENWSPRKKKPWRYRWPDEVRDEVLARLLELNAERAKEEARAGTSATSKRVKKKASKRKAKDSDETTEDAPQTRDLFS